MMWRSTTRTLRAGDQLRETARMAYLIAAPVIIPSPGVPPKKIAEFVGRVSTESESVSIAVMERPTGRSGPGQRPEFDEYTVVLAGVLTVETESGPLSVSAGQAVHAAAGEWLRYST